MACDRLEAPDFNVDADFKSTYVARAGAPLRLSVGYHGRPRPKVVWRKDGVDSLFERAEIHTSTYETVLLVNHAAREDSGKYYVSLENRVGEKSIGLNVKVLGKGYVLLGRCVVKTRLRENLQEFNIGRCPACLCISCRRWSVMKYSYYFEVLKWVLLKPA